MHALCQDLFSAMDSRCRLFTNDIQRLAPCENAQQLRIMDTLTDANTTLGDIKTRLVAFVRERDWEQFHAPKNLSMALAAEAGELMEHFLWSTPEASRALVDDPAKRQKIEEEIADVVIYALEFANSTGIDISAAIARKLVANAKKYPVEKAKGRSEKYTEL